MPGNILTTSSTVLCTHGGSATLTTANSKVMVDNALALLESDVHTVAGCPFQIPIGTGTKPSPCIKIEWSAGATQFQVNGVGVLLQSSVGKCSSAEGAVQGVANIVNTQMKVSAR
ncbi:MAG: hypothetical protein ACXW3C_04475 [Pyrinomonadaceae bacterium]